MGQMEQKLGVGANLVFARRNARLSEVHVIVDAWQLAVEAHVPAQAADTFVDFAGFCGQAGVFESALTEDFERVHAERAAYAPVSGFRDDRHGLDLTEVLLLICIQNGKAEGISIRHDHSQPPAGVGGRFEQFLCLLLGRGFERGVEQAVAKRLTNGLVHGVEGVPDALANPFRIIGFDPLETQILPHGNARHLIQIVIT